MMPNGKQIVIRIPKTSIAFHIQEIPPQLGLKPEYDLDRVNEKLRRLVGDPMLDKMSTEYDDLYCRILQIISKGGVGVLIFGNMAPDSIETIPFILHTPALIRRLREFAEWPIDPEDPLTQMPSVNGEKYPIRLMISSNYREPWINETIQGIDRLPESNKDLAANSLHNNPLIVWGAAALEGFFSDKEMPLVSSYLKNAYGSFPERPDVLKIIGQADALANLLAQYLPSSPISRFVRLCASCGVIFQARNVKGEIVADGMKMLS
jgi:hypothetical protein